MGNMYIFCDCLTKTCKLHIDCSSTPNPPPFFSCPSFHQYRNSTSSLMADPTISWTCTCGQMNFREIPFCVNCNRALPMLSPGSPPADSFPRPSNHRSLPSPPYGSSARLPHAPSYPPSGNGAHDARPSWPLSPSSAASPSNASSSQQLLTLPTSNLSQPPLVPASTPPQRSWICVLCKTVNSGASGSCRTCALVSASAPVYNGIIMYLCIYIYIYL